MGYELYLSLLKTHVEAPISRSVTKTVTWKVALLFSFTFPLVFIQERQLFPLVNENSGRPMIFSSVFGKKIMVISNFKYSCYPVIESSWLLLWFSCSVMYDSLRPHGLQHARLPCPSPIPRAYSNSCPLSQWCHPTISSSIAPFSSCLQSLPVSGSFPVSQLFTSGGQNIGVSASASVLPMNIQDWFPLRLTDLISL